MKNILIMRSDINPGGPASLIRATVEELKKRNYEVFIACGGGESIQSSIDAGASVQVFEELSFYNRNLIGSIVILPKLRKYIFSNRIDTIYGLNSAASLVAYVAILGSHKKIKVGNALIGMRKERLHKKMPFKHVCMSNAQKDYLIKCGLKTENITTVYPSSLDLDIFNYKKYDRKTIKNKLGVPDGAILIGNVMNGNKGRNDFAELIKKVCKANKNVYWLFVGNTSKYEVYKKDLTDSEYSHRCLFLGLRSDIPEIMFAIDVLSHYVMIESDNMETFGMVLTEAMSMCTPVVTNNYGGMTEIVENNITGFLVDNDKEYLESMKMLCENSELRTSMGKKSHERAVALFSKDKYGSDLEAFLKNL